MPHVGKVFPRAKYQDLWAWQFPNQWVPRCFATRGTVAAGSAALPWKDVTVISEPQQVIDPSTLYRWHFQHPTVSALTMEWDWEMILNPSPASNPRYYVHFTWRWFDGSTHVATGTQNYNPPNSPWQLQGDGFTSFNGGTALPGIPASQWDGLFSRWRASNWSEQPDYHPYRWL